MKKLTWVVKKALRHNGVRYVVGSLVVLDDSEAKPLLNSGVVARSSEQSSEQPPAHPPEQPPADNPPNNTVGGNGSAHTAPPFDDSEKTDTLEPPEDSADDVVHAIVETLYAVFGDGEKADKKPNVEDVRKWCENPDITVDARDAAWKAYLKDWDENHANNDNGDSE